MVRANRYILEGHACHLTARCHNRSWLLKFVRDREEYWRRLRAALPLFDVSLLNYCITCNHVHLLVTAGSRDHLAGFMQRLQGEFAESYNGRRDRTGPYWNDRYHATMVQSGRHLWNCMVYIDLNMVRAGRVAHPAEWRWCGYQELAGRKRRYRVIDLERTAELTEAGSVAARAADHKAATAERLARGGLEREPTWTEAIAVGSEEYVNGVVAQIRRRVALYVAETPGGAWMVCEEQVPYPDPAARRSPYALDSGQKPGSKG